MKVDCLVQLEVGKTYIDGYGHKVLIVAVEGDGHVFTASDGDKYLADGSFTLCEESNLSLIQEST